MKCLFCEEEVKKSKAGTMAGDYKKMTLHFNQKHKDKPLKERQQALITLFPDESKGLAKKLERLERKEKKQKNDKKDTKKGKKDVPKKVAMLTKTKIPKRTPEPKGAGVLKKIVKKTADEHRDLKPAKIKEPTKEEPKEPKKPKKNKGLVWVMVIIGIAGMVFVSFILLRKYKKEIINERKSKARESKKESDGRDWFPG